MTDQICTNILPHGPHPRGFDDLHCPGRTNPHWGEHRIQLAVEYADHQTRYYPTNAGWRVDSASRCIVIGRGVPRTHIPLDNVVAWHVERVPTTAEETPDA